MDKSKNIIGLCAAWAIPVVIVLFFFFAGVSNGVKTEKRVAQAQQEIVELGNKYRELAELAAVQRSSCVRVGALEEQMAAINRQANNLRTELSTYGGKKEVAS